MNISSVKVNGEDRKLWSAHVKVDGIWRDTDIDSKVHDRWNMNHKHEITEKNIIGFRLIYKPVTHIFSDVIPYLKHNRNLPVKFSITGVNNDMSLDSKGVKYFYTTEDVKVAMEEGILLYGGALYALIDSGETISVSTAKDTMVNNDDERIRPGNDVEEAWITSRAKFLNITVLGYTKREQSGNFFGWNSFFDMDDESLDVNFPSMDHPDKVRYRTMLPISDRHDTYREIALLGISRNISQVHHNMLNSHGVIDHTLTAVTVNNVKKPFKVEIFN